jgi:hypothetical protein
MRVVSSVVAFAYAVRRAKNALVKRAGAVDLKLVVPHYREI